MSTVEANQPTALEAFREKWIQSESVEQYAARLKQLQSAQPHLFDSHKGQENLGVGRWITIGSEKAADGEHHGGHHVFVGEDGKMKTGAFAGQTMQEAFGGKHLAVSQPGESVGEPIKQEDLRKAAQAKPSDEEVRDAVLKGLREPGEGDAQLEKRLHEHVGKNPGSRLSEIGKAVGVPHGPSHDPMSSPLNRALKRMVDSGSIRSNDSSFGEPTFHPAERTAPNYDARLKAMQQRKDPEGIVVPSQTKPNEEAAPGEQLGLFGEAFKKPATSKPFKPSTLDAKAKQQGLFDTHGNANQMDFFGDGVMPDDLVYKPDKQPEAKATEGVPGRAKRVQRGGDR